MHIVLRVLAQKYTRLRVSPLYPVNAGKKLFDIGKRARRAIYGNHFRESLRKQ